MKDWREIYRIKSQAAAHGASISTKQIHSADKAIMEDEAKSEARQKIQRSCDMALRGYTRLPRLGER